MSTEARKPPLQIALKIRRILGGKAGWNGVAVQFAFAAILGWVGGVTGAGAAFFGGLAVAAGLVPFALGSDTNGSIRVPAAACGVVGFKPAGAELGVQGFITRTVADNAFLHGHRMITPRARIGLLVEP